MLFSSPKNGFWYNFNMFKHLHLSFPLVVFVTLILLTYWLDQATHPQTLITDDALYQNPDYIVKNISGIRKDHERGIHRAFFAETMTHYIDDDITQLEQTRFINTETSVPLIRVHANQAKLAGNGEDIYLTGDVTVLRGADEDEDLLTMMTDYLHLIPHQNLVKTNQSVKISRLNTTINAIGLELDNNTGVIQLLSRVRAIDNNGNAE
jgi:lipopolysaccharide export system protein LptC